MADERALGSETSRESLQADRLIGWAVELQRPSFDDGVERP